MKKKRSFVMTLCLCVLAWGPFAHAGGTARLGASGEVLELDYQSNGQVFKDQLPLYRTGTVRYFSAGVGLDERQVDYPPFPLKLVFTAGGKPFLTGVAVTIQSAQGGAPITIPSEQVGGPWLFVDLAPGRYQITATHAGQAQQLKDIRVEAGKQKVVYVRWAEDRSAGGSLPAE